MSEHPDLLLDPETNQPIKPCSRIYAHAWSHTMAEESYLDLLPSHPIFTTPGPASSLSDSSSSQDRALVVVRNADLIVWTQGELRMTGLIDCKSNRKLGYKVGQIVLRLRGGLERVGVGRSFNPSSPSA